MTFTLSDLEARVAERAAASPDESWTAKLLAAGPERAAKKFGEEAVEAVIAAMADNRAELVGESADLLFHLLVLLADCGVPFDDVLDELDRREGLSGLAEKAARPKD